jgi:uncharacterized linocin/CFP29 family protein
MDFLKRNIAPLTKEIWEELDERAREVFKRNLRMRKLIDVEGPYGWDFSSYNLGTLDMKENTKNALGWGIRNSLPLIEVRHPFELDIWDLDNIERGSETPDLEPLELAAEALSEFENRIILAGEEKANIVGLFNIATQNSVKSSSEKVEDFIRSIFDAEKKFRIKGIEGPYALVINKQVWERLFVQQRSYPLTLILKEIMNLKVETINDLETSFIISTRGDDFKLVLGQDISLGYETRHENKVKLFFTESFTFHIKTPEAIVGLEF